MTTAQTNELTKLLKTTYQKIFAATLDQDDDDSIFVDADQHVYWATPATNSVMSAGKTILLGDGNPLQKWLINSDIISTYLATGELALVAAISGGMSSAVVGAFDRSSSIGMYYNLDWLDESRLREEAFWCKANTTFDMPFQEVLPRGTNTKSKKTARSIVRLRNLLGDCRSHQLTTACGFEIQLADAES
jgi:hypothetical protein